MHASPDRVHALDSLRGFAMFLGVVLHAAISFVSTAPPVFWPARDSDPHPLVDVFVFAVHDFRMQTFFVLAGFFGCLLYRRYGLFGMTWHRVKRVGIPFVLSLVFIIPPMMALFLYLEIENTRVQGVPPDALEGRKFCAELIAAAPDKSTGQLVIDQFTNGKASGALPLAHLWFLYYLLLFYIGVIVLAPLLSRLEGKQLLDRIDRVFRTLAGGPLAARAIVPALAIYPLLLAMDSRIVDTPGATRPSAAWMPPPHLLGYYAVFFAFGWMLYRQRDLVEAFGRGWRTSLIVANAVVLPLGLAAVFGGLEAQKDRAGEAVLLAWRFGSFAAQAVYTWLMIVGLWGAFLRWFGSGSAWARYIADASYWCYLMSILPIVALQFWVKDSPLPGLLKWAFVSVTSAGLLLLSYEWCVRYTFIGAVLNGRKTRTKRAVAVADALTEDATPTPEHAAR
ncbi:MAG: acyltransferase family protein [Gemmataceae bacterium]|nr:acyltransferase family protein [Gemmataceae bacterium]